MIIELICLLSGIGLAIGGAFGFWPVTHGYDFYRPIILFLGGYSGGVFISWWLMAFNGLFVDQKHVHDKVDPWSRFWLKQGLNYINRHALIIYKKKGFGKIPKNKRFLLVCNHRSKFDSMLISDALWRKDIAFITKQSNMKIPLGHKFMWGICYLPIDREDKLQSLSQFRRAEELIANDVCSIGVFPEGTRQDKTVIGSFHEGVFNIAIHAKCPIVIMTSANADQIHHNFPFHPTVVKQEVVKVLYPEEIEDMTAKAVSDIVLEMMVDKLSEYYKNGNK